MRRVMMPLLLLTLAACSHNKAGKHYECSYETSEEAYQRCMEVSEGLDRETREAATR